MTYQMGTRPFLLFRFALREGDFALAQLIARVLWRRRRALPRDQPEPG